MTVLKGLQADGMSFKKMIDINNRLIEAGYSPADCLSYGVGGNLHDSISRSNMSAAQKLAEVGKGDRRRPVMKCPIDEPVKESIPGAVKEAGKNSLLDDDDYVYKDVAIISSSRLEKILKG